LALSLIRLGDADQAIEKLRYVVKVQPGVMEPEYNLAILLEQKHAIAEAVEHLKAANQARPNDVGVMQHLLVDLLATGETAEASQILEQVKAMDSVEARQQVATALLEAEDYSQAVDLLEGLRTQDESSRDADMLLARAYIGAQEDFKAIDLLKPAQATDNTGEAAYLLGIAYSDVGATEEATDAFTRAIRQNPKNGRALYHLGLIESAVPGQMPAALGHLREAIQQEPGNAAYGIALGRIMLQHDNAPDALALLQRVHADGLEAGERDLLLGIAQITVSGPAQALKTFVRAVAENPSLALSFDMLGFCYSVQGDTARAAEAYAKASDLKPKSRVFAHSAAFASDRANDAARAMTYATRAASLPDAVGQDYYFLGRMLAKANQNQDAIRELNKAIAMDPDLEEAYYLLARTYVKTGDNAEATDWVARLKDLKQKHEQADAALRAPRKQITSSTLLQGAPVEGSEPVEH
ncbi:MAG: tetratricopeptide repeat protein, partial [Terracidiphilus sp.]